MERPITTTTDNPCRPLISSPYPSPPAYVELGYNYQVRDLKQLEQYLCPGVKILGVDYSSGTLPLPKSKYKLQAVKGVPVEGEKLCFRGSEYFWLKNWEVDVAIMVPTVMRASFADELAKQLVSSLLFVGIQDSQSPMLTHQEVNECQLECASRINKKEMNGGKGKVIVNRIPVQVLLPKLDAYDRTQLLTIISQDLSSSISIMLQSQLLHRKVSTHATLIPIQTYIKSETEIDLHFRNLQSQPTQTTKTNTTSPSPSPIAPLTTSKPDSPPVTLPSKSSHLQVPALIVVLLVVVGGYCALKFM